MDGVRTGTCFQDGTEIHDQAHQKQDRWISKRRKLRNIQAKTWGMLLQMLVYHHTSTLALPVLLAEQALRPIRADHGIRPLIVFTLNPEPGIVDSNAPAMRIACPTALLTRCSRIQGAHPGLKEADFCSAIPLRLNYLTIEIRTPDRGWMEPPAGQLAVKSLPVLTLPGTGIAQVGPLARLYRRGRHVLTSGLVRDQRGCETLCRIEDGYA